MAFTDPFIRRPVLASVISLLIVLLGIQAFNSLTIRQYPQMESALITVTTAYPGANAETIQGYITQPLQQSLASAEGVDYMTSVSQQNASVISVYARIGADTDRLYTELLSQANSVKNQLPQDAEDPVLNKQAADSTALMYISFYSDQLSNPQITDYLSRVIQPKLATLPGMAEAEILGNRVRHAPVAGPGEAGSLRRLRGRRERGGAQVQLPLGSRRSERPVRGHQHQRRHRAEDAGSVRRHPAQDPGRQPRPAG